MKLNRIVLNDIKKTHPTGKSYTTDVYYQRLANRLQDAFCACGADFEKHTATIFHAAAVQLACYMEDIVADSGPWRMFTELCTQMYHHPVPMYHRQEDYYPDEPSRNAVSYFIWSVVATETDDIVYADGEDIEEMAATAFDILDEQFEEAPVNEELAGDIVSLIGKAKDSFIDLRPAMLYLYNECYLTRGERNDRLAEHHMQEAFDLPDMPLDVRKAIFFAFMSCIFAYRIGPLALHTKDYLAALMRVKGMDSLADELGQIEYLPSAFYRYETIDDAHQRLTHTNGRQLTIETAELNMTDKMLRENNAILASSLVHYQGAWHLNGMLLPMKMTDETWQKACEKDPDHLPPGTATFTAEMMLERTGGRRLHYFATQEELKDFLAEKLKYRRDQLGFADNQGGSLPTLFIDTLEKKSCLHFFFGDSINIADPANPYYDPEKARTKAINMLWDAEAVDTHAVQYLLEQGFLPDVYNDSAFSCHNTREQTQADADFLMRFWRREQF